MRSDFIKNSILAGALIGLGGFVFLSASNPLVGACLFSVGLISVILLRADLYTGKIGYLASVSGIPYLLGMCAFNVIGAVLMGLGTSAVVKPAAEALVLKKLDHSLLQAAVLAFLCGMLIYLAVECYKKTQSILAVVLPVFAFVTSGADHCIANAYYFAAARMISPRITMYMLVCVLCNAFGSLFISFLQDHGKKAD